MEFEFHFRFNYLIKSNNPKTMAFNYPKSNFSEIYSISICNSIIHIHHAKIFV